MPINSIILLITIFLNFALATVVYLKTQRDRSIFLFFLTILGVLIWATPLFFYGFIDNPNIAITLSKVAYVGAGICAISFLNFSIFFVSQKISLRQKYFLKAFNYISIIILAVGLVTNFLLKGFSVFDTVRIIKFGSLYPFYISVIGLSFITGFVVLQRQYRIEANNIKKTQLRYIFFGILIATIGAIITNLILPSKEIFDLYWLGPIFTLIMIVAITYAITKHHLFNIKVIATEIFTGLLLVTLVIDIFNSENTGQLAFNTIIFGGAAVFGFLLIRSVIQEIKAREQVEEMALKLQRAYEELQRLDKTKTEFLSMASHQLRTPLSTIKGYVSMLLEGSYGKLTKKTREKLINVFISNDRLVGIVNDLLNISKIELGKMEVDKKIIQIEEIITSVYEEMLHRAEEKNLQLLWNKPIKPLPKIAADEPKIRQVISNIVDNALKYTNKGKIEINAQVAGPMIRIRISDTGVGLSPEEINVIFSGFMRGSAGINLFVEGSGLGLYVARRYIDLHNGKIWADSKGKGLGSTFYIEIPITLN